MRVFAMISAKVANTGGDWIMGFGFA